MSADRIGERCPQCSRGCLREYFGIGPRLDDGGHWVLSAEYECTCDSCGFHYIGKFADVPMLVSKTSAVL